MSPLTEPPPEACPPPQAAELPPADNLGGNDSALAAANPFLDLWLEVVANDGSLPSEALEVAIVMARSVGIGRVAFTDWQRINAVLGRNRRDPAVLASTTELKSAGYLERYLGDGRAYTQGWRLTLPGEGQS